MIRRRLSENGYFPQSLRQAQIIILEILQCIPVVIIFAFLDLGKNISFSESLRRRSQVHRFPAKDGISASLQQVSRDQYPVSLHYLHHNVLKLGSKLKISAYIDG